MIHEHSANKDTFVQLMATNVIYYLEECPYTTEINAWADGNYIFVYVLQ